MKHRYMCTCVAEKGDTVFSTHTHMHKFANSLTQNSLLQKSHEPIVTYRRPAPPVSLSEVSGPAQLPAPAPAPAEFSALVLVHKLQALSGMHFPSPPHSLFVLNASRLSLSISFSGKSSLTPTQAE